VWLKNATLGISEVNHLVNFNMCLEQPALNVLTISASHSVKPEKEKESFGNEMFQLVSCIPQNEMVVLAGDMNGHVGSSKVGYDGTHGGFWVWR